jgi:hypothetical protein
MLPCAHLCGERRPVRPPITRRGHAMPPPFPARAIAPPGWHGRAGRSSSHSRATDWAGRCAGVQAKEMEHQLQGVKELNARSSTITMANDTMLAMILRRLDSIEPPLPPQRQQSPPPQSPPQPKGQKALKHPKMPQVGARPRSMPPCGATTRLACACADWRRRVSQWSSLYHQMCSHVGRVVQAA